MTWIKTIPYGEASPELKQAYEQQGKDYPAEYCIPVEALKDAEKGDGAGIVNSHSLLPDVLYHMFAGYGAMLSPDLPLTRRQHEMIAATVSTANTCYY